MNNATLHLVNGVIELTKYRKREIIAESLITTLSELIRCERIALFQLVHREEPFELSLVAQIRSDAQSSDEGCLSTDTSAAILACLREHRPVDIDCPEQAETFLTVCPILSHNQIPLGCLLIRHHGMTNDQKYLAIGFLRVYENYLSLLEEGQTDKLTGLLNRHTFDNQILNIITTPLSRSSSIRLGESNKRRVQDESFTYWLAILDIDFFKRINDTYGHVFGDEILILLSRLLKSTFRTDDLLFRYGGEEFVILLRAPGQDEAMIALDRFRKAVESFSFPRIEQVTISIGFARISGDQVPAMLLARADQALYFAKEQGRNQVRNYEQLLASGDLQTQKEESGDIELF